ncbi:LA_2272 family surface repeat-containing protein [Flavobacterium luteum]|uniref:PhaC PHA synthase n=1 Tax=Flavobacterium luteum TaxID=2026654 RepID=A0A7J5AGP2_9FLAO|nr:hypothetical protein [Flavobacterium luteum]KAB1156680.1 hypothetical protein F6464_04820 [Flavobacterium luteum]
MKNFIVLVLVLVSIKSFGQDALQSTPLKTRVFSLSPMSPKVGKVNGFVFGVGHYDGPRIKQQTINGVNLEASPLSLALISFGINIPFEGIFAGVNDKLLKNTFLSDLNEQTMFKVNGLNISSGGFMSNASVNGVNISILTGINELNGLSINGSVIGTRKFNGVCISGIANITDYGNGVQIALSNVSRNHYGVQIGLFNNSKNLRGMQFGLWNTNGKRKLPFLNWQFKS